MNIKNIVLVIIGSVIFALGVGVFIQPCGLTSGGVTGIAIIISRYSDIAVGTLVFAINIPLMIIGVRKFGFKFLYSTLIAIALSSAAMNIFSAYAQPLSDKLLSSIAGGFFGGLGLGMVFRAGATTGGTDIIVKLMRLKYKYIKTGEMLLIIDAAVIAVSALILGSFNLALYASITVAIQTYMLDFVLYGIDESKLVYIVSDKQEEISRRLLEKDKFGVTLLQGEGAYTSKQKNIIMCAIKKQQLPQVRAAVTQTDTNAFMIVTSASEIYGIGFKKHDTED